MASPRHKCTRGNFSKFSDNQISPSLPLTNLDDRGSRRDAAIAWIGAKVQSRNVGAKITDGLAKDNLMRETMYGHRTETNTDAYRDMRVPANNFGYVRERGQIASELPDGVPIQRRQPHHTKTPTLQSHGIQLADERMGYATLTHTDTKTYAALPATNRRPEKADITNSKIQVSFPAMNKKIVCFDTTRHGCIFFNNRFLDTHHLIELVLC